MASVSRFLEKRLKLQGQLREKRGGPSMETEVSGLQHDLAPQAAAEGGAESV